VVISCWGGGGGGGGGEFTKHREISVKTRDLPERDLIPGTHKCKEGAEKVRVYWLEF